MNLRKSWVLKGSPDMRCIIGICPLRLMIYQNFVNMKSLMLHAKFQEYNDFRFWRRFVHVFTIYGHGNQLSHIGVFYSILGMVPVPVQLGKNSLI